MNIEDQLILSPRMQTSLDIILSDPPSAIGLFGERGAGKGHLARYIAANLLEVNSQKLIVNPYFFQLDGADVGIAEIRQLQSDLKLSVPGSSKIQRAVIIEHFQSLGHEAQNALLKTLEEPPLNTVLVLTIDNIDKILPTIISRLQLFEVGKIGYEEAVDSLGMHSESDIKKAFVISGGSAGLMMSLLQGDESHELLQAIEYSKKILREPKYKRIGMIDSMTKSKDMSVVTILDGTARLLRAALNQTIAASSSRSEIQKSVIRLKLVSEAIEDINHGAGQKLILTRLFLAL